MNSNKHEIFIRGEGFSAFITGVPDKCDHDYNGPAYYITASGKYIDYATHKNWVGYTDAYRQRVVHWYYSEIIEDPITGGGVTCSKCNKALGPPLF